MTKGDFYWLNEESRLFLKRGYLLPGTTPEERINEITRIFKERCKMPDRDQIAEDFKQYMTNGWYSLSSPVWSNYGLQRGLPISCFGSYVDDSVNGIVSTAAEIAIQSQGGGGTSAYLGHVRPRGSEITNNGKSNGSFSFLKLFDTTIDVISQGTTRRGQSAVYIDIEHPDIEEWLGIHTEGNPIQLLFWGVSIGKKWFQDMKDGDEAKQEIWTQVLERKSRTGIPYIFFKDNANDNKPEVYKDSKIYASNLCTEIMLPASKDESFVCCLSSMNLLHYEDWKNTRAVKVLAYFLDTVLDDFISKADGIEYMQKSVRFAKRHRALGIGVLGWHSYLQSNMIAFESYEAFAKNAEIHKLLQQQTNEASVEMGEDIGYPEMMQESKARRNTTMMAIAPTKSSSFILGQVSQSVEPMKSNYYVNDRAKIKTIYRNPYLKALLAEKDEDTEENWMNILINDGSVQQLECLTVAEKEVFKTFREISQLAIVQQAAQRQKFIDQGQSINIILHPDVPLKDINQLYIEAEQLGLKSLYYQINLSSAQELNRNILDCTSCES